MNIEEEQIIKYKKIDNTLIIIAIVFNVLLNLFIGLVILLSVQKHSVHPEYGNYKKYDSHCKKCAPWDECK